MRNWLSYALLAAGLVFSTSPASESTSMQPGDLNKKLINADHIRSADHEEFKRILGELEPAFDVMNQDQRWYYIYLRAYSLFYNGQLEQATELFKQIFHQAQDVQMKFRAAATLVNVYAFARQYVEGVHLIQFLLRTYQEIESVKEVEIAFMAMGIFYNHIGDHEAAIKIVEKLRQSPMLERTQCIAHYIEAEALLYLHPQRNLLQEIAHATKVCEQAEEPLVKGYLATFEAHNYLNRGQPILARESIDKALSLLNEVKYTGLNLNAYSLMARSYIETNDFEKAKQFAKKIIEHPEQLGNFPAKSKAYEILANLAEREQNYKEALHYQKEFAAADKLYLDDVKIREVTKQKIKNDSQQTANRMALLDKQNALLQAEKRLADEKGFNDRLIAGLSLILAFSLLIWAYRNKRLQRKLRILAQIDDLTGISNRPHFNKQAIEILQSTELRKQPVCFIIFDLDHFKKVNDNYGHQTGDWALKNAVDAAKTVCRHNDVIGRMGGEEFAILLPRCDIEKALQIAELCRKAIAKIDCSGSGHLFSLSASFGVASTEICGYEFDHLFAAADMALYQSKHQGRNQVYVYNNTPVALSM